MNCSASFGTLNVIVFFSISKLKTCWNKKSWSALIFSFWSVTILLILNEPVYGDNLCDHSSACSTLSVSNAIQTLSLASFSCGVSHLRLKVQFFSITSNDLFLKSLIYFSLFRIISYTY